MIIARANIEHVESIIDMVCTLLDETGTSDLFPPDRSSIASLVLHGIALPSELCSIVAIEDDSTIGCLIGLATASPFNSGIRVAQEVALWVSPDHRGRGVAGSLLDAFTDWAADNGMAAIAAGHSFGCSEKPIDRLLRSRHMAPKETHYIRRLTPCHSF